MDVRFWIREVRGNLGKRGEACGGWAAGEWTGFVGYVGFEGLLGEGGIPEQGLSGGVFVFDALLEWLFDV